MQQNPQATPIQAMGQDVQVPQENVQAGTEEQNVSFLTMQAMSQAATF